MSPVPPFARLAAAAAILLCALPAAAGWEEGRAAYERRDWAAAARELQPLAGTNDPAVLARLGHLRLLGLGGLPPNQAEGLSLLTKAAEAGDPLGQFWLGNAYRMGLGLPRDPGQAFAWTAKAAERGVPEALHNLGAFYYSGAGVAKDEARALDLFQRALDAGFKKSGDFLGTAYWNGRGAAQDRARAVTYLKQGAEGGWSRSQLLLGLAYWNGEGNLPRDPAQAVGWFHKAADRGEPDAQYNLGIAYSSGVGTAKDPQLAYFWHFVASRAPNKPNFEKARDEAAAKLPLDEAGKVRYRAQAWKPLENGAPIAIDLPSPIPPSQAQPAPGTATAQPKPPEGAGANLPPAHPPVPRSSAGSGVVVTRDGAILTNAHVAGNCKALRVQTGDGAWVPAELTAKDGVNDLALLKTQAFAPAQVARFRDDRPLRSGDEVVVVGYPLSNILSREANVTAGVISALAGIRGDKRYYQLTAPVQKGNSGGPLADMSGNVVGVVSAKLNAISVNDKFGDLPQNINFAIKGDLARKFLSDNQVAVETARSPDQLSAADVGERIKAVTVFVECGQ